MTATIVTGEHTVVNELGLHARPASKFVALANKFASEVFIGKDDTEVNGKSILGVLMLACPKGGVLSLRCVGPDAQEAHDALAALIREGFGES